MWRVFCRCLEQAGIHTELQIIEVADVVAFVLEFDVVRSYDSDLLENIINLGGSSPNASLRPLDTTNQAYIFGNLVVSGLYDYTRDQIGDINSYCASTLYEYITNKIIEKFALKISLLPESHCFAKAISGLPPMFLTAMSQPISGKIHELQGIDLTVLEFN